MASRKTFTLNILNQTGVVRYGEYEAILVPTSQGETAIMAFHTPSIILMTPGHVRVHEKKGFQTVADIKSGVVYVGENEVTVLINEAATSEVNAADTAGPSPSA
jgi:F0F1-type ATP synthase epsilon subunit